MKVLRDVMTLQVFARVVCHATVFVIILLFIPFLNLPKSEIYLDKNKICEEVFGVNLQRCCSFW